MGQSNCCRMGVSEPIEQILSGTASSTSRPRPVPVVPEAESPCNPSNMATISNTSAIVHEKEFAIKESKYSLQELPLATSHMVFSIDFYATSDSCKQAVYGYFRLCKDYPGLHVTTSCFIAWRKNKKTNGSGKVIPALTPGKKCGDRPSRVFFFDDNLEFDGKEASSGICNLRDISTGCFVEFTEGKNGFVCDKAARQTIIHHSPDCRVVLIKANILDAMADLEYFSNIVKKYSEPGEQIIVYMDVNATIVCNDSIQGKDVAMTLLGTMFEFVELRPTEAFDLIYEDHPPLKVEKAKNFKQLIKEITLTSHITYTAFWEETNCWNFFDYISTKGEVRWVGGAEIMTKEKFKVLFKDYLKGVASSLREDGIAYSWFKVFETLQAAGHTVVLNSFGVDTWKVVKATLPKGDNVLQVAVNHELWDERDANKFRDQFKV